MRSAVALLLACVFALGCDAPPPSRDAGVATQRRIAPKLGMTGPRGVPGPAGASGGGSGAVVGDGGVQVTAVDGGAVVSLKNTAVTAGTYSHTPGTIVVNAQGQITSITDGVITQSSALVIQGATSTKLNAPDSNGFVQVDSTFGARVGYGVSRYMEVASTGYIFNIVAAGDAFAWSSALGATFGIQQPFTTANKTLLALQPSASAAMTASTELVDYDFGTSTARTNTWATGALTTQRGALFRQSTYAFAAASTLTNAATVAIVGAPIQGTNATITNSYALWIQAGTVRFDGLLNVNSATGVIKNSNASAEATSATAGSNGAVPSQVRGYFTAVDSTGATVKVPYFAN